MLKGPFEPAKLTSSSKSRDRSIEKPRCSRTSVKCCRRVCSRRGVGLNLVRSIDLELVRVQSRRPIFGAASQIP